ncbi:MAG: glutathione S-transferase [Betaproteobacteria bacterium]|nr:glutathione S-transferase [Betaproteobacteria bacterium]
MKLYVWASAPNPRRVRMFLHEKGIQVPMVDVSGPKSTLSEDYRARYPQALVPMLELDDGTQIGEAMAICRYFETLHPDPPLMGTDAKDRALVTMWEQRAYNEGMIGAAEVFRNTHPLYASRSIPGHAMPMAQLESLVERGRQRVVRFCEVFDRQLADSEFVAGDRFSVADITALCAVDFARTLARLPFPSHCVHLQRWHDALSARPSAKA